MKTTTLLFAFLFSILATKTFGEDEANGRRYEPTAGDLAAALGMMWWTIIPPEGAEEIEFGIASSGEFQLIARDECGPRSKPSAIKVVYRDLGSKFDLVALSNDGSLFMSGRKKPSEFRKVLNPARGLADSNGFEFVRFQSEDRKSWDKVLVCRFFGAALESGKAEKQEKK